MSKTLYARCQKITDAVGRENYITSPEKEERIYEYTNVDKDYWVKLQVETELGVNDCREIHFMLPNNLKGNQEMIEEYVNKIADDFHEKYGVDFIIGCHDKEENLHCHLMFNERECINPNATQELESKMVRARWYVDGQQSTKKEYTQAMEEGGHDCEYVPKHEVAYVADRMFSNKIEYFKDKQFLEEFKQDLAITMNEIELKLETGMEWQRELQKGHLAQVHVGNHAPEEVIDSRKAYNEYVKEYNQNYDLFFDDLKHKTIDELQELYNTTMNLVNNLTEQIDRFAKQIEQVATNFFGEISAMFSKADELELEADSIKLEQENTFQSINQVFQEAEKLDEKADELEYVANELIQQEREGHTR